MLYKQMNAMRFTSFMKASKTFVVFLKVLPETFMYFSDAVKNIGRIVSLSLKLEINDTFHRGITVGLIAFH